MDESIRRAGADHCVGVVMEEVHRRRLLPAVLVAVDGASGQAAVFPCGPTSRDAVASLLELVAAHARTSPAEAVAFAADATPRPVSPDHQALFDRARAVRLAQIAYFKDRSGANLAAARKLEHELDVMLGLARAPAAAPPPSLFDEAPPDPCGEKL